RICGSFSGDAARFLHFLPFINERNQRLRPDRAGVHVCLLGPRGRTPLENLSIGDFSWPFTERSSAGTLFRTAIVGHGSFPKSEKTRAMVAALRCTHGRLRSVGRPEPGAKYDSISFALQDGVRFLARWRLVAKVRDVFAPTHPKQCCHAMERIDAPPQTVFGQLFWHRHHLCWPVCPFSLRGSILHPTQPVRDLRFSSWFKFLCFDLVYSSRVGRYAVLPAASNPLGCGCRFTCDLGSRKSFCGKTSRRFFGNFRFVCR